MIAALLAEPVPGPAAAQVHLLPLVPAVHGFAALATFMLAVTAALQRD